MDYKEIWNEICYHVTKNRYVTEQDFHKVVELLFEKLGWSLSKGEIISEVEVNVGASRVARPDILIKKDGTTVLVVELKRVNTGLSERNEDQIKSYMRLMRLEYGVLLGETIQVYYEMPDNDNSPIKLCNINFSENSEVGMECIEVLSKNGFSFDRLNDFARKCLSDQRKYCEQQKSQPGYVPSFGKSYSSPKSNNKDINFVSMSSEYGKTFKGSRIYAFLCQPGNEYMYIGKQNIEQKIRSMSKMEMENTSFYLNDKPSSKSSSWVRGDKFKQIYESK